MVCTENRWFVFAVSDATRKSDLKMFSDEQFSRQYGFWRPYVEQVIYRYLDCGDLQHGFARVKCKDCGHEYLLAFLL